MPFDLGPSSFVPDPGLHSGEDVDQQHPSITNYNSSSVGNLNLRHTASDGIKRQLESKAVILEIAGDTLLVKDIKGQSAEKVEQAASEGNIGTIDTPTEGAPNLKLPAHKVREMETLGITSIEVHSPSGVRTFKSFKIQALSDKELDLLITQVKTYIVFLKAQADPEDKKARKAIAQQELKLSRFVVERAIRKNDPRLEEIIRAQAKSHYSLEMMLMKMWAEQKAIRERQQDKIEANYWENKHVQQLKQDSRQNEIQQITKQVFLKQEANMSIKQAR